MHWKIRDKEKYPWMCESVINEFTIVRNANLLISGTHYLYPWNGASDAYTTKWFWNKDTGKWETDENTSKSVPLQCYAPTNGYVKMVQSEVVAYPGEKAESGAASQKHKPPA